jgi:nicotinamide mononucleotide transporter
MTSNLEIAAAAVTTVSILLAGRNSVHTWWTGILGCLLFGILFFQVHLFADVALQIFFVGTSALGWYQWKFGNAGKPKKISVVCTSTLIKIIPLGFLVAGLYGFLLYRFTAAYAPFLDSGILVFSVIAQLLMMRRNLQSWIFWLIVNSVAVPLYANRELYLTAVLYACYWVNALVAYRYWRNLIEGQHPEENYPVESLANDIG